MDSRILTLDGLGWLLVLVGPLLLAQRALHRELQWVLLLLTQRKGATITLFALLFLPGVFLHELSHYLMAHLLRVPTGRFSILPRQLEGNQLQMGVVETANTDILRDGLIGAAPLLAGGSFIAVVGLFQTNLFRLGQLLLAGELGLFFQEVPRLPYQADFWVWFYLVFVVSSTMFPSASDRRAWLPILLVIAGLIAVALLAGAGPWLLDNLGPGLNAALRAVAAIFVVSLAIHLLLLFPVWLIRRGLNKLTGLQVG